MSRRGFVGAFLGIVAGLRAGLRGPRQVWDIAIPGHAAEFLALGYRGVAINGRRVTALRVDLARGEVLAFARDAKGNVYARDGELVREVLRGRVELLRGARG